MHNNAKFDDATGKPDVILFYNITKLRVDTTDQLVHSYSMQRIKNVLVSCLLHILHLCIGKIAKNVLSFAVSSRACVWLSAIGFSQKGRKCKWSSPLYSQQNACMWNGDLSPNKNGG